MRYWSNTDLISQLRLLRVFCNSCEDTTIFGLESLTRASHKRRQNDPKSPEKGTILRGVHSTRSQPFCASKAVLFGHGTDVCGQLRLNGRNCLRHSCSRKALISSFLHSDSNTKIVSDTTAFWWLVISLVTYSIRACLASPSISSPLYRSYQ